MHIYTIVLLYQYLQKFHKTIYHRNPPKNAPTPLWLPSSRIKQPWSSFARPHAHIIYTHQPHRAHLGLSRAAKGDEARTRETRTRLWKGAAAGAAAAARGGEETGATRRESLEEREGSKRKRIDPGETASTREKERSGRRRRVRVGPPTVTPRVYTTFPRAGDPVSSAPTPARSPKTLQHRRQGRAPCVYRGD